jgi:hypothetical protein
MDDSVPEEMFQDFQQLCDVTTKPKSRAIFRPSAAGIHEVRYSCLCNNFFVIEFITDVLVNVLPAADFLDLCGRVTVEISPSILERWPFFKTTTMKLSTLVYLFVTHGYVRRETVLYSLLILNLPILISGFLEYYNLESLSSVDSVEVQVYFVSKDVCEWNVIELHIPKT